MSSAPVESVSPVVSMVVEVAPLSDAVDGTLSYEVPVEWEAKISVGVAVVVPLKTRLVAGIVISFSQSAPVGQSESQAMQAQSYRVRSKPSLKPFDLKPIHLVLDEKPALNAAQLALARWMSQEYCAPLGRCCALMVPPGMTPNSAYLYSLASEERVDSPTDDMQARIVSALRQHGPLIESKLKSAVHGVKRWRSALDALAQNGWVKRTSTLEPALVKPRRTTMLQLVVSDATLEIVLRNLEEDAQSKPHRANAFRRRVRVLVYLQQHYRMAWAEWVYAETGANRADLEWLSQKDYILMGDAERWRDPLADIDYVVSTPPPLTSDQARAWEAVSAALSTPLGANTPTLSNQSEALSEVQTESSTGDDTPLPTSAPMSGTPPRRSKSLPFLLRGVTGSGKTEVYMRAVDWALQHGLGALVLVPEISLTPQTARRFLSRFPGKVALIHSGLKPGERYDTWRRIRSGELPVVVGARSALFAPLPCAGVIVLDEEHDQSYKQSSPPYYDTRRVAMQYAKATGATLIMGSATPSLEAWRMAQENELRVLELPNRVRGHVKRVADQQRRLGVQASLKRESEVVVYQPLPNVQVIDMRAELRGGNFSIFSGALATALTETLQRGEQALLFLNRRGTASCVLCRDCGHVMRCPRDEMPLTYHEDEMNGADSKSGKSAKTSASAMTSQLKCHQCTHVERVPARCPVCHSTRIRFVGIGTQKVEQALHEQFARARVVRWDKDASTAARSADQLLQRFVNQQADVLVGTQMIAKGLDLPMVTLVGVILADVGLFLPDFRASERVFGLIEQVAGRAGRGLLPGRVIVQTYNPDHPAIRSAAQHDVAGFARAELEQRKRLNLPPYVRLVRIEATHVDEARAQRACEMVARQLRPRVERPGDLIGPAPAYFGRRGDSHRWHLFVRTQSPRRLLEGLEVPHSCIIDVDPLNVL